jgi:DNA polymerase I-like protein with 3'-5' exonuclease and polymerase domains
MKIVTPENFDACIEELLKEDFLAVDTETTGLQPWKNDRLFSIQFSNSTEDYYFNFQEYTTGEAVLKFTDICELQPLFYLKTIFIQNAKFDMAFLWKEGIRFDRADIHCTEVAGRLLRSDHLSYSLDNQSKRELGESKDDRVMEWLKEHKAFTSIKIPGKDTVYKSYHFEKVPFELISSYGCLDTRLCYRLGMKQIGQLQALKAEARTGQKSVFDVYVMEKNLTHACLEIERVGIKIDEDYCNEAIEFEAKRIHKAQEEFTNITGKELTDSGKFLGPIFEELGFKPGKTDTGEDAVTDSFLSSVSHPISKVVREYRDASKRANTYFKSFLYYSDTEGVIHPNMKQAGTSTGRFSYIDPNCLSMDTEVLTKNGWVNGDNYAGQEICVYNNGKLTWEVPSNKFISSKKIQSMITVKNEHFDMRMTDTHRVLHRNRKTLKELVTEAKNFPKDSHIIHGGLLEGTVEENPSLLKLLIAIQADGHIINNKSSTKVSFEFIKERKIKRLISILEGLPYDYSVGNGKRWRVVVDITKIKDNMYLHEKKLTFNFLILTRELRTLVFEELKFWDGDSTRKEFSYCSRHIQNMDVVQAIAASIGYRCHIYRHSNKKNEAYVASFVRRDYSGTANSIVKKEKSKEKVWCVKVSSGFFLARRGSDTFITGNCQNIPAEDSSSLPVRRAFVPRLGYLFLSIDYNQMEFRMMLDEAGQFDLIEKIKEGHDPHQATADLTGLTRSASKTLNFGLLYGMGIAKLAIALGCTFEEAKSFKKKYFRALPMVENFIVQCSGAVKQRLMQSPGNGWVRTWLGRRAYFNDENFAYRAANSKVQGGAADLVKTVMVILHEFLLKYQTRMVLQIHDEIVFELHEDEMELIPKIMHIMENTYPYKSLPLTCSMSFSLKSLYDLQEGDPRGYIGKEARNDFQGKNNAVFEALTKHVVS